MGRKISMTLQQTGVVRCVEWIELICSPFTLIKYYAMLTKYRSVFSSEKPLLFEVTQNKVF